VNESIERLAHAVLLPAVGGLETSELIPLLDHGCRAVLLGETRTEYLARAMSAERAAAETAELIRETIAILRGHVSSELLVAVDHEVVGIRRFDHLLPDDAPAEGLRRLGVNVALGPIVDVVRGENPWLSGRNLGPDPVVVASSGREAVEEFQAAGIAAVAKHYPGHPVLPDDPAVAPAVLRGSLDGLEEPFEAVVAAGVRGIMLGPAVVEAVDPAEAASCSPSVVRRARERLGFRGTLVSDDLDAAGILRGRTVGAAAVASLAAGADLLLVSAHVAPECAEALTRAVSDGRIAEERLVEAAASVCHLEMEPSTGGRSADASSIE
jgi:beta-N-acetylhexosaminidase